MHEIKLDFGELFQKPNYNCLLSLKVPLDKMGKYPIHMVLNVDCGRISHKGNSTSCNLVTAFCKFCKMGARKIYSTVGHPRFVIMQSQSHLLFKGTSIISTTTATVSIVEDTESAELGWLFILRLLPVLLLVPSRCLYEELVTAGLE